MKEEDKIFMDACRPQYEELMATGSVRHINLPAFVDIMKRYYEKDLYLDQGSYDDVKRFLHRLYAHYDREPAAAEIRPDESEDVEITVL